MNIKKKDKILLIYLNEENKIDFFTGIILKIKKYTIKILKKNSNNLSIKILYIKNPNIISIKKIK